jgi:hypothetical protein
VRRILFWAGFLSATPLLVACRSGGRVAPSPAAASAPASTPALDVKALQQAFANQNRVLRHRADEGKWRVKRTDLPALKGDCDAAVLVRSLAFEKGTVALSLELIGRPRVGESQPQPGACRSFVPEIALTVVGFEPADGTIEIAAELDRLLPSPEAYLAAHGITFDLASSPPRKPVADNAPKAPASARRLARIVKTWSRSLLSVDAAYADASGKGDDQKEVEFTAIVGTDGRLHEPHLVTTLATPAHEAQVMRALSLWRLDPARKRDQKPIASRLWGKTILHVYGSS